MPVSILDFYNPLPIFGVPLSQQWEKFRTNSDAIAPIVRGAYVDTNANNRTEHDLTGLAFGELDFRNRYRIYYDKSANEFLVQYNTGSEATPTWTTRATFRDTDGRLTINSPGGFTSVGGFYNLGGLDVAVTAAGGEAFGNVGTLLFSSNSGFYLTPDSSGRPIVNIDAAAISGSVTEGGNLGAGGQVFKNKTATTLNFRSIVGGSNVTVTQNTNDLTIAASDTGEVNTASNLGSGQGVWFDKQGVDLRFKSLVAGSGIGISATNNEITLTSPPNFYGIIFKESDGSRTERDDTLVVDSNHFYLDQAGNDGKPLLSLSSASNVTNLGGGNGVFASQHGLNLRFKSIVAGASVTIDSAAETLTINSTAPGFYGVLFKESRVNGNVQRDDTLVVDSAAFYLQQLGNTGKPLLGLQPRIELNQLDMNGFISFLEITEPTNPASDRAIFWTGDDHGNTVLNIKDSGGQIVQVARDSVVIARNTTGSTLAAGSVVYISGVTGDAPNIALARSDSLTTMPGVGILPVAISNNSFGRVFTQGIITGLNLSAFSSGDNIWVSPTSAGSVTPTEPTHPNSQQQVGVVIRATSNGIMLVNMDHANGDQAGTNNSTFTIGTSSNASIVLANASTAQRTATFQNKSGTVAYLNDIGPAFYGLLIKETESGGYAQEKDVLNFDSTYFYIDGNSKQQPVVSFRDFGDVQNFADNVSRRNTIINGDFNIWQRNTTFTGVDNLAYTADRWQVFYAGATGIDGVTVSRSTTVPMSGTGRSTYSLQYEIISADSSIGSSEVYLIQHPIEGHNIAKFGFGTGEAQFITLSFWAQSSLTGTYCVAFRNALQSTARTYIAEYTINSANTWEKKTITLRADAGGSWNKTTALGLSVGFIFACGSGLQTTANSWQNINAYSTSNQVNFWATAGNIARIARVQLELGVRASEFDQRLVSEELAHCQRYFAKTFRTGTAPANGLGTTGAVIGKGAVSSGNVEPLTNWFLPSTMRTVPTVTLYNTRIGGAPGQWQEGTFNDSANARVISTSETLVVVDNTGIPLTGSNQAFIHITVDAEF